MLCHAVLYCTVGAIGQSLTAGAEVVNSPVEVCTCDDTKATVPLALLSVAECWKAAYTPTPQGEHMLRVSGIFIRHIAEQRSACPRTANSGVHRVISRNITSEFPAAPCAIQRSAAACPIP